MWTSSLNSGAVHNDDDCEMPEMNRSLWWLTQRMVLIAVHILDTFDSTIPYLGGHHPASLQQ